MQTQLNDKLSLAGGTITGGLVVDGKLNGATPLQVSYLTGLTGDIQSQVDSKLNLTGGNITYDLSVGGYMTATHILTPNEVKCDKLIINNQSDNMGSGGINNEWGVHAQIINLENNFWATNGITDCNTAYNGTMLRLDNRSAENQYYQFWMRTGSSTPLLGYLSSTNSGMITTSDSRLKNTIVPVKADKSLRILDTNVVSFFYNHATEDEVKANKKSIGVIRGRWHN